MLCTSRVIGPKIYKQVFNSFLLAIAEVYKNQGNEEYRKKDFINAIHFYTEGIKVNCKDKELKAQLYSNRAIANYKLGKNCLLFVQFFSHHI